jgi:hypothetical protein
MTGGWSSRLGNSGGKTKRLHYFHKDNGHSLCGMMTLTDNKGKKFIKDEITNYNKKKVCKTCLYNKSMVWLDRD